MAGCAGEAESIGDQASRAGGQAGDFATDIEEDCTVTRFQHRCVDNNCPYLGKASPINCGCHRTAVGLMAESHAELLDAAQKALNFITNTEGELGMALDSGEALRAAIAKAAGQ